VAAGKGVGGAEIAATGVLEDFRGPRERSERKGVGGGTGERASSGNQGAKITISLHLARPRETRRPREKRNVTSLLHSRGIVVTFGTSASIKMFADNCRPRRIDRSPLSSRSPCCFSSALYLSGHFVEHPAIADVAHYCDIERHDAAYRISLPSSRTDVSRRGANAARMLFRANRTRCGSTNLFAVPRRARKRAFCHVTGDKITLNWVLSRADN